MMPIILALNTFRHCREVQGQHYLIFPHNDIRSAKYLYTGCPRRNVPDFGRVFLMLKYTDITQNTGIQS